LRAAQARWGEDIMSTTRNGVNMALISAIVAVATIGGLLFG
jgi:hypothetical protein